MTNNKEFDKYKQLFEGNEPNECQACGGPLMLEKVNLEDYQGGKLYIMEKVPAFVCQACGEVWVPEPVMLEFEKMIQTVKSRKMAKTTVIKPKTKPARKKKKKGANKWKSR